VADQHAFMGLGILILVVVQQRLLQGYTVEINVLFDVTTVRSARFAIVSGSQFFFERRH